MESVTMDVVAEKSQEKCLGIQDQASAEVHVSMKAKCLLKTMAGVIYCRSFTAFLRRKAAEISWKPPFLCEKHFKRQWSSTNLMEDVTASRLKEVYKAKKHATLNETIIYKLVEEKSVFANNELSLRDISVYGFDYDYTLAHYTDELNSLIYQMSLEKMITEYSYPEELRTMPYDPEFVIRGLHIDINKGVMMKIDSYQNIMPGTAYRGHQPISEEDIHRFYRGTHIGNDQIIPTKDNNERPRMRHMIDLFANSEATLMANVFEETVRKVHRSGQIGSSVEKDIGRYLRPNPELRELLQSLIDSGKQTFLITNSDFNFVNKGMCHIMGEAWMKLFDVIITSARKPSFYQRTDRPFRSLDSKGVKTWERVTHFHGGELYTEGNVEQFMKFTGWYGPKVLYFGDHVYSDLMGPILKHGWRTGAIIHDLENEIRISNTEQFRRSVTWLLYLQELIEALQTDNSDQAYELLREWKRERYVLREELKRMFNPQFGSVFRTYHNPSYFTRRLVRFADIYSSSISNLLNYPNDVTFYPRRQALPHEPFIEQIIA